MNPTNLLHRSRTIAPPDYNRWLVPPAALAVHLSIGQAYAFSVFKTPLTQLVGLSHPASADWTPLSVSWIFSLAIAVLGLSAATLGPWVERAGPRLAMFAAACCFSSGLLLSSLGVHTHHLWLLYLGYGVIGGVGLGIGYIAPVSTLLKWFPDRPGMAAGLAIMGFGGGAMIGGPLAVRLMSHFSTPTSNGVAPTLLAMALLYFAFMLFGSLLVRLPSPDYAPAPRAAAKPLTTTPNLPAGAALRTPQFYLLWLLLCLNTTAGIGILEQASPMIQELFRPRITPAAAAGFVGLLSLFNMAGRFFWSTLSDLLGRRLTFLCFFTLGPALFLTLPHAAAAHNVPLFVAAAGLIISMYGAGFATMPAYVRDLFGPKPFPIIYGRILTAWSVAGLLGPYLVNKLHQSHPLTPNTPAQSYAPVLYTMAALLALGFVLNLCIRPVAARHFAGANTSS